MKNTFKYLLIIVPMLWLFLSCSEKEPVLNPDMTQPIFNVLDGPPGSLGAVAREYFDRWGSIVVYDFTEPQIRWTFSGSGWLNYYVPAKPNTEQSAEKLLTFLKTNLFERFPEEFMRRILPYNIFLVDTLHTVPQATANDDNMVDVDQSGNRLVIANVRPGIDTLSENRWNEIRNSAEGTIMRGVFNTLTQRPVTFFNLRMDPAGGSGVSFNNEGQDPEGIITHPSNNPELNAVRYSAYLVGYVKGYISPIVGTEGFRQPEEMQDFVDFTQFLTQSPGAWLEYVLPRFSRLRIRAIELEIFLRNVVGLDVIATQRLNNPTDPLPSNFFERMARL